MSLFALLGLGTQEIVLLLIIGVLVFGIPVAVALALVVMRRPGGARVAELEAENRRLREQLGERGAGPDRPRT